MKTILRLSDYEDKDHFRQVQIYCIHFKRKVYIDTGVKTKANLFDPLAVDKPFTLTSVCRSKLTTPV
ncbi:MAG TPA: hypothetical protein PKN44_15880, partial [Bacteroidales bacterium]|nr:hypothetical protein [Bacteroidales bacterium]HPS62518.1 hypothetical protein [Bacteroidales bacterium]